MNDLEKKLVNAVRHELKDSSSRSSASPHVGGTQSRVSTAEMQAQISQKLREGQVNDAFALALHQASQHQENLSLVIATCEMVSTWKFIFEIFELIIKTFICIYFEFFR